MSYRMIRCGIHVGIRLGVAMMLLASSGLVAAATTCDKNGVTDVGFVMDRVYAQDLVILNSPKLAQRVKSIIDRLTTRATLQDALQVVIYNDSEVNSFSGPTGSLYLSAGFVEMATDEELAWVIAHEIAHLENCDVMNEFNSTMTSRKLVAAGAAAMTVILAIVTVGAGAAAMGPMGTATTASNSIIQAGSLAMTTAISIPSRTGKVDLVRPVLARSYADQEHASSPVYAPALFSAISKSRLTGFGDEAEDKANNAARIRVQNAGFSIEDAPLAGLMSRAGGRVVDHLVASRAAGADR